MNKIKAASATHLMNSLGEILRHVAGAKYMTESKPKKREAKVFKGVTGDTTIASLLKNKDFDDLDWLIATTCFEVTHNVEIPTELSDDAEMTLSEFIQRVAKLPQSKDPLFRTRRIASDLFYPSLGGVAKMASTSVQREILKQQRQVARVSAKLAEN